MGNSEVGHLNLGAGAVIKQDLTRIDEAVRGRRPGRERGAARRARRRSAGAPDRARQRRRRALLRRAPARADRPGRRARRPGARRPRLHRRARHLAARRRAVPRRRRGLVRGRGPAPRARRDRSSGATSRWTATGAGTASSRPTTCSCTAAAQHTAATAVEAVRAAYARGETDEFVTATAVGDGDARIRPGDSVLAFNFRPDRMREITRALADPPSPRSTAAARRSSGATRRLTEYEEGWPYPVAFRPARPEITLPHVVARDGRAPAPRGRDGEVPARDLLLRRRRGGAGATASGASWCRRRATSRPTTTSPR